MHSETPKNLSQLTVLMVPVSCTLGTGEYMRSLIIAEGMQQKFPGITIEFVLNKHAPYATSCPFPTHLINASPTKEKQAVNLLLQKIKPNLVIFDASGRAAHARYAKKLNARVAFISQYGKKRKKGFALNRLPALDAHWITQYKFVDGDLTYSERLKLKLLKKQPPLFVGPIFSDPQPALPNSYAALQGKKFSVWAAGGGGQYIQGKSATKTLYEAACKVATPESPAIVITGANFTEQLAPAPNVHIAKLLPNSELMTLLAQSAVIVCGGGAMVGQAVSLGANVVAIPLGKDQPPRIKAFLQKGLIRTSAFNLNQVITQYTNALNEPLSSATRNPSGLHLVLNDIERMLA